LHNLPLITLLLIINDIHLYEGTYHITAICRTGPRVTHVVHAGDLIPAGTILGALASTTLGVQPCKYWGEALPPWLRSWWDLTRWLLGLMQLLLQGLC